MPKPPKLTVIIPAADKEASIWQYTTVKPGNNWMKTDYDASGWKSGKSGFGTPQTPGAIVGTLWNTDDIWLRKEVDLKSTKSLVLSGWLTHDDDAEVYINGVLAIRAPGAIHAYEEFNFNRRSYALLTPGKVLIAVHCHNTVGDQYVDFGIVGFKPTK
jgi:hypothetical protein